MDKKKVIELIGNVEKYLLAYEKSGKVSDISMASQQLHEAEDELSKSDWISVEDELPPYGEDVLVKTTNTSECVVEYFISSRDSEFKKHYLITYDENDFQVADKTFHVTHWRKIDKLEV